MSETDTCCKCRQRVEIENDLVPCTRSPSSSLKCNKLCCRKCLHADNIQNSKSFICPSCQSLEASSLSSLPTSLTSSSSSLTSSSSSLTSSSSPSSYSSRSSCSSDFTYSSSSSSFSSLSSLSSSSSSSSSSSPSSSSSSSSSSSYSPVRRERFRSQRNRPYLYNTHTHSNKRCLFVDFGVPGGNYYTRIDLISLTLEELKHQLVVQSPTSFSSSDLLSFSYSCSNLSDKDKRNIEISSQIDLENFVYSQNKTILEGNSFLCITPIIVRKTFTDLHFA